MDAICQRRKMAIVLLFCHLRVHAVRPYRPHTASSRPTRSVPNPLFDPRLIEIWLPVHDNGLLAVLLILFSGSLERMAVE
jgi:hypothetical protein